MSRNSAITFRILHIVIAVVATIICIVLAFATGGHPPGIVFIPFVLAYWIISHLVLFGLKLLLGYMETHGKSSISHGWPPLLTLLAVGSGLALLPLLYGLFHDLVLRSKWTELNNVMWAIMIFIPPTCLFGGIVYGATTGSRFARWIAALGPISFIGYIFVQLGTEIMTKGYTRESWINVVIVVGICATISSYLVSSSIVKEFFASRKGI